jgi:allophanate hydrolase subunit 1
MIDRPRISSLGDDCVTVDFGNEISIELNSKAIALAARLNTDRFEGFIEAVPAYSSVSVFFKLAEVRRAAQELETALASVTRCIDRALERSFRRADIERTNSRDRRRLRSTSRTRSRARRGIR